MGRGEILDALTRPSSRPVLWWPTRLGVALALMLPVVPEAAAAGISTGSSMADAAAGGKKKGKGKKKG